MTRVLSLCFVAALTGCSTLPKKLPAPAAVAPPEVTMNRAPVVDVQKESNAADPSAYSQFIEQPAAPAAAAEPGFVPVASAVSSTHLEPAKERIFYYGPSVETGIKLDPSRESLKIRDAAYDASDEARVSAPPSVVAPSAASTAASAPVSSPSLIAMRRLLSGSTEPRDGFFRPLGVHDDSLAGRRQAEARLTQVTGFLSTQGLLVWDTTNGWGWFTPTGTEN